MKRRLVLQSFALVLVWPAMLAGQTPKRFRVGCLWIQSAPFARPYHDAFLSGLRDQGYAPGRDVEIDVRYADGDPGRLPALADELIALKPDVLVGVEAPARTIRARTTAIPIVLAASVDPVATGLVRSLSRPGVNVTGMALRLDQLVAKNIELLAEIVPSMLRLALITYGSRANDPSELIEARIDQHVRKAATAKHLQLVVARVQDAKSVKRAFAKLESEPVDGIVVAPSPYALQLRQEIADHAKRLRLPSISALPVAWAEAGGLISYGPHFVKNYRYAASFVARILKGANPAEMPIEQPTVFELVVNLRTAREIGVAVPQSVLLRADEVIE